jgi:uncharacterized protein (TIGR02246 family)
MEATSMSSPTAKPTSSADELAIRALYDQLLAGWNQRNADAMAEPFLEDGESIGFDGSQQVGRAEIAATMGTIFADHSPAAFVAKVRSVRFLGADAAILRAVAGMVPPGKADIEPKVNTHHTVIAQKRGGQWGIALFQNTPAQFHGRPDLVEQLTEELRALL